MRFKRAAFGYRAADVEDFIDDLTERHDVELEHKDIEIRRLKAAIEQLQSKGDESELDKAKISELEAVRSDLQAKLAEALSQVDRLRLVEQSVPSLEAAVQKLQTEVSALDSSNREKASLAARYEQENESLRSELRTLRAELSEHSEERRIKSQEYDTSVQTAVAANDIVKQESSGVSPIPWAMYPEWAGSVSEVDATIDELSDYLSRITIELGQKAFQKTTGELENFRRMALALRTHLAHLTTEVNTYRTQEKAVAQALIQAQIRAGEIEQEALSEVMKKKMELEKELAIKQAELETTKSTMARFKTDLASVLDSYKRRLTDIDDTKLDIEG